MAVVAGVVFFAIRALFTLLPAFANRHAIKKCPECVPAVSGRGPAGCDRVGRDRRSLAGQLNQECAIYFSSPPKWILSGDGLASEVAV